jgi:hypothetical protein
MDPNLQIPSSVDPQSEETAGRPVRRTHVALLTRPACNTHALRPQHLSDTCQRRGGKDMQGARFSLQSFT